LSSGTERGLEIQTEQLARTNLRAKAVHRKQQPGATCNLLVRKDTFGGPRDKKNRARSCPTLRDSIWSLSIFQSVTKSVTDDSLFLKYCN